MPAIIIAGGVGRLMKTNWWPWFGAAIGTLATVLLAHRLARYGCSADLLKEVSPGKVVFSCAEFWLNRYQSLFGSILAAGVAGATLFWVVRQFDAAIRQTSIASAQALRHRVADLKEERNIYRKASGEISGQVSAIDRELLSGLFCNTSRADSIAFKAIEITRSLVPEIYDGAIDSLTDARAMVYGIAVATETSVHENATAIFQLTAIVDPFSVNAIPDLTEKEVDDLRSKLTDIRKQLQTLKEACDLAAESTSSDLDRTWKQIRRFEERAVKDH